nr:hypothetical protein Iba_chr14eCG5120 [Ipomoea batatas]
MVGFCCVLPHLGPEYAFFSSVALCLLGGLVWRACAKPLLMVASFGCFFRLHFWLFCCCLLPGHFALGAVLDFFGCLFASCWIVLDPLLRDVRSASIFGLVLAASFFCAPLPCDYARYALVCLVLSFLIKYPFAVYELLPGSSDVACVVLFFCLPIHLRALIFFLPVLLVVRGYDGLCVHLPSCTPVLRSLAWANELFYSLLIFMSAGWWSIPHRRFFGLGSSVSFVVMPLCYEAALCCSCWFLLWEMCALPALSDACSVVVGWT